MKQEVLTAKKKAVDEMTQLLENSNSAIVVNYRGLDVTGMTDLRKQLRDSDVSFHVVKNNIISRAADNAGYSDLKDVLSGPTAVAFSKEDPIAPAKIIKKFIDDTGDIEFKGGVIEQKVVSLDTVQTYASLPSREELLSSLASVLQAPVRNFAYGVKAIADKKNDGNDGDAA